MSPDAHLVLVRHAEPVDRHRCHGARSDPGLSPLGQRQAASLGLRIRLLRAELGPVRRLVCSPAARAIATAVHLSEPAGRPHVVDARWRERDFGDWEGRPWDELWPTVPAEVTADPASYLQWTPPGGEHADAVATRLAPVTSEALTGDGTTVVVTHAGAIRQALASTLGLPLEATWRIEVPYARMVVLTRTGDAVTLARVGA